MEAGTVLSYSVGNRNGYHLLGSIMVFVLFFTSMSFNAILVSKPIFGL